MYIFIKPFWSIKKFPLNSIAIYINEFWLSPLGFMDFHLLILVWFWLTESPYPAVSEHVTEEETPTEEPKGTDIMGEGFTTPDSASPVTDIHKVRYNLHKSRSQFCYRLIMLSFKMNTRYVFCNFYDMATKFCLMHVLWEWSWTIHCTLKHDVIPGMCEIASTYTV